MTALSGGRGECSASISGYCLNVSEGDDPCVTEDGECIHGGQPTRPGARYAEELLRVECEQDGEESPFGWGDDEPTTENGPVSRRTRRLRPERQTTPAKPSSDFSTSELRHS